MSQALNITFDGNGIDLDNGIDVSADYASIVGSITKTSANEISIAINAMDGPNDLVFSAFDTNGYYIQEHIRFLAGSRTITVDVLDDMSSNVTTGSFKAIHTPTNTEVSIATTNGSNQFVVNNAPASDLYLYFVKTDGDFAGKRIDSTTSDLDLTLRGFSTISATANPDLSQGSTGWTFDTDYVTLVQVDGENRFQIELDQGESTEYSHAFTASQGFLSKPVQLKGNIIDAHINVILRNYTQNTVAIRSLSPRDLGYDTDGEFFSIFEGYVTLGGSTGDQMEIIVQIVTPLTSMRTTPNTDRQLSYIEVETLFGRCRIDKRLFDLYQVGEEDDKNPVEVWAHPQLNYLSLGAYPTDGKKKENGTKSSVLYILDHQQEDYCQINSIKMRSGNSFVISNTPFTVPKQVFTTSNQYQSILRQELFLAFEFDDTSSLLPPLVSSPTRVDILVRYSGPLSESEKEKKIAEIPRRNILTWYGEMPDNTYSGNRDKDEYDRGERWVHQRSREFLDHVYTVKENRADFKINDISNINGGTFYGHGYHLLGREIDFHN